METTAVSEERRSSRVLRKILIIFFAILFVLGSALAPIYRIDISDGAIDISMNEAYADPDPNLAHYTDRQLREMIQQFETFGYSELNQEMTTKFKQELEEREKKRREEREQNSSQGSGQNTSNASGANGSTTGGGGISSSQIQRRQSFIARDPMFSFPNKEIEDEARLPNNGMFSVTSDDFKNFDSLASWICDYKSYIVCQDNNGYVNYFFNTPNLQKAIYNMLQADINDGGYSGRFDESNKNLDKDTWTTAAEKYGWNLPSFTYAGEKPAIQLDMTYISNSMNNPGNAAKILISSIPIVGDIIFGTINFFNKLFTGETYNGADMGWDVMGGEAFDSLKGITYNLKDYENSSVIEEEAIEIWLSENWANLVEYNQKDKVFWEGDPNDDVINVLRKIFNPSTDSQGKQGRALGTLILDALKEYNGGSYVAFMDVLFEYAKNGHSIDPPQTNVYRHMPYSIKDMSEGSKAYMNYVVDPRVAMFEEDESLLGLVSLTAKYYKNMFNSALIAGATFFAGAANSMNEICNFSWLKDNHIDLGLLWKGTVGTFILFFFGIILLFVVVRNLIKIIIGGESTAKVIGNTTASILLFIFCGALIMIPDKIIDTTTDIASKVMDLGTSTLELDESFKEMSSSDASNDEKTVLRYWMIPFNAWTIWNTNHPFGDDANRFDPNDPNQNPQLQPVKNGGALEPYQNPAKLNNGETIDLWSGIALESSWNNRRNTVYDQNGNIIYDDDDNTVERKDDGLLRTIDHFMAPIVTKTQGVEFTTQQNPVYNGYVQQELAFPYILLAFEVFLLNLYKLFAFIEFAFDLMLLLIRLLSATIDKEGIGTGVKDTLKALFQSLVRIILADVFISLLIFLTFNMSGIVFMVTTLLILAGLCYFVYCMYKNPTAIYSLAFMNLLGGAVQRARNVVAVGKNIKEREIRRSLEDPFYGETKRQRKRREKRGKITNAAENARLCELEEQEEEQKEILDSRGYTEEQIAKKLKPLEEKKRILQDKILWTSKLDSLLVRKIINQDQYNQLINSREQSEEIVSKLASLKKKDIYYQEERLHELLEQKKEERNKRNSEKASLNSDTIQWS